MANEVNIMFDALSFLHSVENYMGRDLSQSDGDRLLLMLEQDREELIISHQNISSVQHYADLFMTNDDYIRVYGG